MVIFQFVKVAVKTGFYHFGEYDMKESMASPISSHCWWLLCANHGLYYTQFVSIYIPMFDG